MRSHATPREIGDALYTFLVNAPLDVTMPAGQNSYVFFLDAGPVKREFLPQNYQLIYTDQRCSRTFTGWAETVIRCLCASNRFNGIPAFDQSDVASVLSEVHQLRVIFLAVTFTTKPELPTTPDPEGSPRPVFNRLLAVLFSPFEWGGYADRDEILESCQRLGRHVVGGGAFHPYDEGLLMLLGDPAKCGGPSDCIKNDS